ncbi:MAG: hypothetical protein WBF73_20665 [Bradyrhizobium sp.]|jgi:hypothetical protein
MTAVGAKRKFGQMAMSAKCHDHEERSLGDENALQAPNDQPYHPDYFRAPNEFGFNLVCQLGAADLE